MGNSSHDIRKSMWTHAHRCLKHGSGRNTLLIFQLVHCWHVGPNLWQTWDHLQNPGIHEAYHIRVTGKEFLQLHISSASWHSRAKGTLNNHSHLLAACSSSTRNVITVQRLQMKILFWRVNSSGQKLYSLPFVTQLRYKMLLSFPPKIICRS